MSDINHDVVQKLVGVLRALVEFQITRRAKSGHTDEQREGLAWALKELQRLHPAEAREATRIMRARTERGEAR